MNINSVSCETGRGGRGGGTALYAPSGAAGDRPPPCVATSAVRLDEAACAGARLRGGDARGLIAYYVQT